MDLNKLFGKLIIGCCVIVVFVLLFLFFVVVAKTQGNFIASLKLDIFLWIFFGLTLLASFLFKKSKYNTPEFAVAMQKIENVERGKAEKFSPYYMYTGWNLVTIIGIIFFFILIGYFFGLPDLVKL